MSLEMFENCSGQSCGAGRPAGYGGGEEEGQSSRSWMLLDSNGQCTVLDDDKYTIMHRVQIHARDFRILDSLLSYPSTILGCEGAIVLKLEHIKAIITSKEVLLRDPMDANVTPVFKELKRQLAPTNAIQLQKQEDGKEYSDEHNDVEAVMKMITFTNSNLERVHQLNSATTELKERVQKVMGELKQLWDDHDNMRKLYLTRKLAATSSSVSAYDVPISSKLSRGKASITTLRGYVNDVKELEMLLELCRYIDNIEDYINIQVNNFRKRLIQLDFFFSSVNICFTILALMIESFGKNIPEIYDHNHGYKYKWVVIMTGVACAILFGIVITYARHKVLVGS